MTPVRCWRCWFCFRAASLNKAVIFDQDGRSFKFELGVKVLYPHSQHLLAKENNQLCPLFAVLIAGKMLSCLDNRDAVPVLQVDPILPLEVNANEDRGGDPPTVQSEPRRGHGRGRKAKGRRLGATAAANNGKGEETSTATSEDGETAGEFARLTDSVWRHFILPTNKPATSDSHVIAYRYYKVF